MQKVLRTQFFHLEKRRKNKKRAKSATVSSRNNYLLNLAQHRALKSSPHQTTTCISSPKESYLMFILTACKKVNLSVLLGSWEGILKDHYKTTHLKTLPKKEHVNSQWQSMEISIRNITISFLFGVFSTQVPKVLLFKGLLISISQLPGVIQPRAQSPSTIWEVSSLGKKPSPLGHFSPATTKQQLNQRSPTKTKEDSLS